MTARSGLGEAAGLSLSLVTSTLFLLSCLVAGVAHPKTLPADLAKVASSHGCEGVDDFYDRPGMVEPAFVYGFVSGIPKSESAIFWCRSKTDKSQYRLVAHAPVDGDDSCEGVVVETSNFPRGLSLSTAIDAPLSGYSTVEGTTVPPFSGGGATVVSSMYDGVGSSFICRGGEWLIKRWD